MRYVEAHEQDGLLVDRTFLPAHPTAAQQELINSGATGDILAEELVVLHVGLGPPPGGAGVPPPAGSVLLDASTIPRQRRRTVKSLRLEGFEMEEVGRNGLYFMQERIPAYSAFVRPADAARRRPMWLPRLDARQLGVLASVEQLHVDALPPLYTSASAYLLAHGRGMQLRDANFPNLTLVVDLRAWLQGGVEPMRGGEAVVINFNEHSTVIGEYACAFQLGQNPEERRRRELPLPKLKLEVMFPRNMFTWLSHGKRYSRAADLVLYWLGCLQDEETPYAEAGKREKRFRANVS